MVRRSSCNLKERAPRSHSSDPNGPQHLPRPGQQRRRRASPSPRPVELPFTDHISPWDLPPQPLQGDAKPRSLPPPAFARRTEPRGATGRSPSPRLRMESWPATWQLPASPGAQEPIGWPEGNVIPDQWLATRHSTLPLQVSPRDNEPGGWAVGSIGRTETHGGRGFVRGSPGATPPGRADCARSGSPAGALLRPASPKIPRFGEWAEDSEKLGQRYSSQFQRAALRRHSTLGVFEHGRAGPALESQIRLGSTAMNAVSVAEEEKLQERMVLAQYGMKWMQPEGLLDDLLPSGSQRPSQEPRQVPRWHTLGASMEANEMHWKGGVNGSRHLSNQRTFRGLSQEERVARGMEWVNPNCGLGIPKTVEPADGAATNPAGAQGGPVGANNNSSTPLASKGKPGLTQTAVAPGQPRAAGPGASARMPAGSRGAVLNEGLVMQPNVMGAPHCPSRSLCCTSRYSLCPSRSPTCNCAKREGWIGLNLWQLQADSTDDNTSQCLKGFESLVESPPPWTRGSCSEICSTTDEDVVLPVQEGTATTLEAESFRSPARIQYAQRGSDTDSSRYVQCKCKCRFRSNRKPSGRDQNGRNSKGKK